MRGSCHVLAAVVDVLPNPVIRGENSNISRDSSIEGQIKYLSCEYCYLKLIKLKAALTKVLHHL